MDALEVIKKNVIYFDTILPLEGERSNLKLSAASNISEYSLETFINIILQSNQDVEFNTIQYSKKDKKVYFYTDKEISMKNWQERITKIHKQPSNVFEILEQIKDILVSKSNKDSDCVCLYDVSTLIKTKKREYEKIEDYYSELFDDEIEAEYGDCASIIIYGFDYDKKELRIGFKEFKTPYKDIVFSKRSSDLYLNKVEDLFIKNSKTSEGVNILRLLGNDLSNLYDEFLKYEDFETQRSNNIKSINSSFFASVDKYGVEIKFRNFYEKEVNEFLMTSYSYDDEYEHNCNSAIVLSTISGNEDELFKRIFVRIDDLPEWCRPILYENRKNQLLEEEKIENEIKRKEEKKQKRLELKRKIFPFLNK